MPEIFIGSSTNGLNHAEALKSLLERESQGKVNCTIWTDKSIFELNRAPIDSLIKKANELKRKKGFALLLITPDDELRMNAGAKNKGKPYIVPRDNVIFELGLFTGRLGLDRVICVRPDKKNMRMLSDRQGLTDVLYRYQRTHIEKSLKEPVERILVAIKSGLKK